MPSPLLTSETAVLDRRIPLGCTVIVTYPISTDSTHCTQGDCLGFSPLDAVVETAAQMQLRHMG